MLLALYSLLAASCTMVGFAAWGCTNKSEKGVRMYSFPVESDEEEVVRQSEQEQSDYHKTLQGGLTNFALWQYQIVKDNSCQVERYKVAKIQTTQK